MSLEDLLEPDPYRNCEEHCNHDLVCGILVRELLDGPGPYSEVAQPNFWRGGWPGFTHIPPQE